MTRARGRLIFHAPPGQKPVRSSTHKAAVRPLDIPQLQRPQFIVRRLPLPPGAPLFPPDLPNPNFRAPRESVREILTAMLVFASGDPGARMCWERRLFRDEVVLRYSVILLGWPPDVPFWNLSKKGGPRAKQMRSLLKLLTTNPPQLYFTRATEEQLRMARLASSGILPSTLHPEVPPLPNLGRSNIGRRHTRYDLDGNVITPRHVRDGPTSAKVIEEEPEDGDVDADEQPRDTGPLPRIRNAFGHLGWYATGWQDLTQDPRFADHSEYLDDSISEFSDEGYS